MPINHAAHSTPITAVDYEEDHEGGVANPMEADLAVGGFPIRGAPSGGYSGGYTQLADASGSLGGDASLTGGLSPGAIGGTVVAVGATATDGGGVEVSGGSGTAGGSINITSGDGGTDTGALVQLSGAGADNGGGVHLYAGNATSGNQGAYLSVGGGSGEGDTGGGVQVTGGIGDTDLAGGNIQLTGGTGGTGIPDGVVGGRVLIMGGGIGDEDVPLAGTVYVEGGDTGPGQYPGSVEINGGSNSSNYPAGSVLGRGGNSTTGTGGNALLIGGDGANGGAASITGGISNAGKSPAGISVGGGGPTNTGYIGLLVGGTTASLQGPDLMGGTADPNASGGITADRGSLYWRNNSSTEELWFKLDSSVATSWIRLDGPSSINVIIDGAGAVIATGIKGNLTIPFAGTITAVTLLADVSGSIVIDLWKDTYANYPPVDADSITASAPPTISSATKSTDSTLTGWTTTVAAGDIIRMNVDSCTTITNVTLALTIKRT